MTPLPVLHGPPAGCRRSRAPATRAWGLAGGLPLLVLSVAALVALTALLAASRPGADTLDRELRATAAATSVLEVLRSVPYAALPAARGEPGLPDTEWKTLALRCPGWDGGMLGEYFHPLSRDGPFERWLQLQELTPWPGSSRAVKLATVTVRWDQPATAGADGAGTIVMRAVLSPAGGLDESVVPEP